MQHTEVTMRDQVAELAEQGRKLAPDERSRLVDMLLESLHEASLAEVEAAWDVEVEHRLAAYERGEMQSVDGEEVLAKARRLAAR
jgi:putative addiction module component (TIGR02574 family)